MRDLTPFQALILQTHRYLDEMSERGVDVKAEQQWKDRLAEAERRTKERRTKIVEATSPEQISKVLGDDLTERMKLYREKRQKDIDEGRIKIEQNKR